MCSGNIASQGCKLRDPWEQLSITTVVLWMGKLRHREGGAELASPKPTKVDPLAPCITYLSISTPSSLIRSTEVASCKPGLTQARDQVGKAAGARLRQSCSRGPKCHTPPAPSGERFPCVLL